jgi:hypothetical protein
VREHPEYRRYLVCCKACGIRFFADPRNEGRDDLRCPFGCRDVHQRQNSNERSKDYYQSPEGKMKKKQLNQERRQGCCTRKSTECAEKSEQRVPNENGNRADCTLISYLRALIGLLENRTVSRTETIAFIHEVRQQGIAHADYHLYINKEELRHPP